jgi:hypothetical protein
MDAIFFVPRTGCPWNALNVTGIRSSSSAHRRFLEWTEAGVFQEFWRRGLLAYDQLLGIDRGWLALDGALGKAPLLGGGKNRPEPDRPGRVGQQAEPADGRARRPARPRGRRRPPERPRAEARDRRGDPGRAAGADARRAAGALPRQGVRLSRGAGTRGRVRLHAPPAHARRGDRGQAPRRCQGPPLGGRSSAPTPGSTASAAS